MAFIDNPNESVIYQPGWFLAHEECTRETRTFKQDGDSSNIEVKEGANGSKYVPMGSLYKNAEGTAEGVVYEDVDVSIGDAAGSVVTAGKVYKDRLTTTAQSGIEEVTTITLVDESPKVERPEAFKTATE